MYAPSKTTQYYSTAPPTAAPQPSMGIPAAPFPLNVQSAGAPPTQWSTGLCQCCDDPGNCCITCFCPCVTFGQIAEIVDRGSSSCGASGALYTLISCVTGCACVYSCFYRSKMRRQYGLAEGSCPDCIVHCFCEGCALCQEYRELKNRGYDLHIGWQANMEKQALAATAPPPVESGMTR